VHLAAAVLVVAGCVSPSLPRTPGTSSSAPATARPSTTGPPASSSAAPARPAETSPHAATIADVDRLTARLRDHPTDAAAYRDLGLAFLQRARETADPSFYDRAAAAFAEAVGRMPADALTLVGVGGLQLARHAFADALETGRRAVALAPELGAAHGVVVDALVELGRYDEAVGALQEMIELGEDLPSLARVSYLRELHGDLAGALQAMERAAAAGSTAAEGEAFVITLVGDLAAQLGDRERASAAYDRAQRLVPGYAPAWAGQGRLAVAAGDLDSAVAAVAAAADVLPLPEYVVALGEAREAAGDEPGAADAYALARVEADLLRASGVVVDLELAVFEADHGDPARAVRLAEAAYADRRTVHTADALAWALHRAGRTSEAAPYVAEALRLGTRRATFRYHAGMIALAMGDEAVARRELRMALDADPGFSATGAAAARAALVGLSP
jgi:pentatricopeptide repeat protein